MQLTNRQYWEILEGAPQTHGYKACMLSMNLGMT